MVKLQTVVLLFLLIFFGTFTLTKWVWLLQKLGRLNGCCCLATCIITKFLNAGSPKGSVCQASCPFISIHLSSCHHPLYGLGQPNLEVSQFMTVNYCVLAFWLEPQRRRKTLSSFSILACKTVRTRRLKLTQKYPRFVNYKQYNTNILICSKVKAFLSGRLQRVVFVTSVTKLATPYNLKKNIWL